jgi:hypothetical protein
MVPSKVKNPTLATTDMTAKIVDRSIPAENSIPLSQYWKVKTEIPMRITGGDGCGLFDVNESKRM